jgi:hypothetical protein
MALKAVAFLIAAWLVASPLVWAGDAVPVDLDRYSPRSRIHAAQRGERLHITWPLNANERGLVIFNLRPGEALLDTLGTARGATGDGSSEIQPVLRDMQPAYWVTAGSRQMPPGKPADQQWQVFFDAPATRKHDLHPAQLVLRRASVRSTHDRASVVLAELTAGPFRGQLEFEFFAGSPLILMTAVMSTDEDMRAYLFDAGLLATPPHSPSFAWIDTQGKLQRAAGQQQPPQHVLSVRHRLIAAETAGGAVSCFTTPHQFHFPRDLSTNLGYVWYGGGHLGAAAPGFGIRMEKTGGGSFVPWYNAPPGSKQRMTTCFLLSSGKAEDAIRETLRLTNNDRFPELPGYLTMTSHWHMAIAVAALERAAQGKSGDFVPEFVSVFKDMNVNMVHLGEFHGDGHQKDAGPLRLRELTAMFDECRRLSDDQLLLIPGEEVNTFLGLEQPGKHPGHWMSLFPRPVYWIMQRGPDQSLVVDDPKYGKIYRVGSRDDMRRLIEAEGGLVWAAHPRIKASSWTPDIFRHEDFFIADSWLGGAWKAMPADLSHPRLGKRVLDLLDDMANWGHPKYVLGEVDVFKIDRTHELYAHMNVNYLELDRLPRFDEGWQSVLDVLRAGRFFVTTGEVLIPRFTVGGCKSGQTLKLSADAQPELVAELRWTFPLRFAEVVTGDGQQVYREAIDLADTGAYGQRTLKLRPNLKGRRWVRLETWDVVANGAFTQPVWLQEGE